jgi:predicted Holliday junction resolvase-like endonuclease
VRRTWIDTLREREDSVVRAEERFEERRDEIREKAWEKGYKQVPKLLKKCTPVICAHGYYPQDLKALFDPVDFVIFDGMNQKEKVKQVVFFDGPAHDRRREIIQKSMRKALKKGNYQWHTVRLDEAGRVKQ